MERKSSVWNIPQLSRRRSLSPSLPLSLSRSLSLSSPFSQTDSIRLIHISHKHMSNWRAHKSTLDYLQPPSSPLSLLSLFLSLPLSPSLCPSVSLSLSPSLSLSLSAPLSLSLSLHITPPPHSLPDIVLLLSLKQSVCVCEREGVCVCSLSLNTCCCV